MLEAQEGDRVKTVSYHCPYCLSRYVGAEAFDGVVDCPCGRPVRLWKLRPSPISDWTPAVLVALFLFSLWLLSLAA